MKLPSLKFFSLEQFRQQVHQVNNLDKNYDTVRMRVIESPGVGYEKIADETAHSLVQSYRTLVWMLTYPGMQGQLYREMQQIIGKQNQGDPEARNETKDLWDKLGTDGIPEHKRAGEMEKITRIPRSTLDKRINSLNLRKKKSRQ